MVKIKAEWEPGLFVVAGMFGALPTKLRQAAVKHIDTIARRAKGDLQRLTPGENLPKAWAIETEQTIAFYRKTIRNEDPRAYEVIEIKDGRSTNLVELLEYGTSPKNPILPKNKKALAWVENGEQIIVGKVNPRGIRPYGMVRISHVKAAGRMARLQLFLFLLADRELRKGK